MSCPKCESDDWKSASFVYKSGISNIRLNTSTIGAGAGIDFGGIGIGGGVASSHSNGTQQSRLSIETTPPVQPIAGLVPFLVISTIIIAIIFGSLTKSQGGWFMLTSGFMVIASLTPKFKRDFNTRLWNYNKKLSRWEATRVCQRCGHLYFPEDFDCNDDEEVSNNIKASKFWTIFMPMLWLIFIIYLIFAKLENDEHRLDVRSDPVIMAKLEAQEKGLKEDSNKYIDNNDGTVTSKSNGLIWQRCSVGQIWANATCNGEATKMSWDDATKLTSNFANYNNWRLPTNEELLTIIYCPDSTNPKVCTADISRKINTIYFPNTPDNAWTSVKTDTYDSAMIVSFFLGVSYPLSKDKLSYVRLVRIDK
jgi:hypothetical protein